jgi:hypothetical protein
MLRFDFFGKNIFLNLKGQEKHKTIAGGIISIICFIFTLIIAIFFGNTFLSKINFTVRPEKITPDEYPPSRIVNSSNFLLPFRIEDLQRVPVKDVNLHPHIIWVRGLRVNGEWKITYNPVNVTKCSNVVDNFSVNSIKLDEFLCPDFRNQQLLFGGDKDANFQDYFFLSFDYCEKTDFSKPQNCSKISDLQQFLKTNYWYFSIYYPEVQFSPGNFETPMKIKYKNYRKLIYLNLRTFAYFYFSETQTLSDQGWIWEDIKTDKILATTSPVESYLFIPESDITRESSIFPFNFYFQKEYTQYSRNYQKFQDFFAQLSGITKLVLIIGQLLNNWLNDFDKNMILINSVFSFRKLEFPKERQNPHIKTIEFKNPTEIKSVIDSGIQNLVKNGKNSKLSKLNIINNTENDKIFFPNLSNNDVGSVEKKIKHFDYNIKYMCPLIIKACNIKETQKNNFMLYKLLSKQIHQNLDILEYFGALNKFELVQKCILSEEQVMCLNLIKKKVLTISSINKMKETNFEEENQKIISYLKLKKEQNNLSRVDNLILENFERNIEF